MNTKMTLERATEFGAAWNSRDPSLVASFFADDGVYHASIGPDHLGLTFVGKDEIRRGAQVFFDRFPDGRFENLKVNVLGEYGTLNGTSLRPERTERRPPLRDATCWNFVVI